jgi:hypothetical protein
MAEENESLRDGNIADAQSSDVSTLDALHLEGKSAERLDDAEDHELPESSATEREDVKGLANVQSADRQTYEAMRDGAPAAEGAIPTGGQVVADPYTPSEPDNTVEARFENPFPQFAPAAAAETGDDGSPLPEPARDLQPEVPEEQIEGGLISDGVQTGSAPAIAAAPEQPEFIPEAPPEPLEDPELIPTVAQPPTVIAQAASGIENQLTKLTLSASLNDIDGGGESLASLAISGIPANFQIVDANGNPIGVRSGDTWTLSEVTPLTLDNIYLKNIDDDDGDFSGDFVLTVGVTSSEPGSSATTTVPLPVHIVAVADTPVLATYDSAGLENEWIGLDIRVTDKDIDGSETQQVYISDLPAGASLRYFDGNGQEVPVPATAVSGSPDLPDGTYYVVPAAALSTLQVRSAPDDSADFTLTVHVSSTEGSNGDTAFSGPETIVVDVGLVVPEVSPDQTHTVDEGQWVDLALKAVVNADMAATDTDGHETLHVYIEGLPDGVTLRDASGPLTPVTYTDAAGNTHTGYEVTGYLDSNGDITGLQVRWTDENVADTFDFQLRAVVHDVDWTEQDGDDDASPYLNGDTTKPIAELAPDIVDSVSTVTVNYNAVADVPVVTNAGALGVEDQWFSLHIDAHLTDTDGSETLSFQISGDADSFSLRADGGVTSVLDPDTNTVTYTVTQAQLASLQIKGAPEADGTFDLTVTAIATETSNGHTAASAPYHLVVDLLSDADQPTVTVVDGAQRIDEDSWFALNSLVGGTAAVQGSLNPGEAARDDGSEILTFSITAKQDHSRIWIDANKDGVTDAGEITSLGAGEGISDIAADLVRDGHVHVGGATDWSSANDDDNLKFDITTTATEIRGDSDTALEAGLDPDDNLTRSPSAASTTDTLTLTVSPGTDQINVGGANVGVEDQHVEDTSLPRIAVTPTVVFTDTDGSETPDPEGYITLSSGDSLMTAGTLYLDGQEVTEAGLYDSEGNLLARLEVSGGATSWIISNAYLEKTADNTWTLTEVTFQPDRHDAGNASYSIAVDVIDAGTRTHVAGTGQGTLEVQAIADTPTVAVHDLYLEETAAARAVALSIDPPATPDGDGSETLVVYVLGVPAAVTLSAGTRLDAATVVDGVTIPAGSYRLTAEQLEDLKANLPAGYSDDFKLTVYSASTESTDGQTVAAGRGTAISEPAVLSVEIGVQTPTITVGTLTAVEDIRYALSEIKVDVPAHDATDTVTISISELTSGFTLWQSNGSGGYTQIHAQGGVYDIPYSLVDGSGNLSGLYIRSPQNVAAPATFTLTVTNADVDADPASGTRHEQGALSPDGTVNIQDTVTVSQQVTVNVTPDADPATLSASAVGVEDKFVALNISAALQDTDGSENITVTITGMPAELDLYQGDDQTGTLLTPNADGSYTFMASGPDANAALKGMLADLRIYGLAANSNVDSYGTATSNNTAWNAADFTLKVTAKTTETANDDTAEVSNNINVRVFGDADTPFAAVVEGATRDTAIAVDEDVFYNLRNALWGASGEDVGSASDLTGLATTSADGSEVLSFVITATQSSNGAQVVITDANGNATTTILRWNEQTGQATNSVTVTAQQIKDGMVQVGGAPDWAGEIEFNITPKATETDGDTQSEINSVNSALNASNNFDNNPDNNLTRNASQTGDTQSLWLKIAPVVDVETATFDGKFSGVEDDGPITFAPVIKVSDTDSETVSNVQILVHGGTHGTLEVSGFGPLAASSTVIHEGKEYAVYTVPASALAAHNGAYTVTGLTYTPDANSDLDLVYCVRATITDTASTGTDSVVSTSNETSLVVRAVADEPGIRVGDMAGTTTTTDTGTAAATLVVDEDGYLHLNLGAVNNDSDSETLTSAILTDVPVGWTVLYKDANGEYHAYPQSGPTTWDLSETLSALPGALKTLENVYLHPPENDARDASLIQFKVTSTEAATGNQVEVKEASTTIAFDVVVNAQADQPNLQVGDVRMKEDELAKLDIRPSLVDEDGSETLGNVTISGTQGGTFWYKDGDVFREYTGHETGGTWTFSVGELDNLYFKPAPEFSTALLPGGKMQLSVTVTSIDSEPDGEASPSTADDVNARTVALNVFVTGVADEARVPDGGIVVTAREGDGIETGTQAIDPGLKSYASIDNQDGSETLSVVLSGIPKGVTLFLDLDGDGRLDAGEDTSTYLKYIGPAADGSARWSVAPEYVDKIRLLAPKDYSGEFQFNVDLITTEKDGDFAKVSTPVTVVVDPVADTPGGGISGSADEDAGSVDFVLTASVGDTGGNAGNPAALGSGGVEKIDGITDVVLDVDHMITAGGASPTDVYVTYGGDDYLAVLEDGRWVIRIGDVAVPEDQTSVTIEGLTLHGVPENYSHDISVSMTVKAVDGTGATASHATNDVSGTIVIKAVADAPAMAIVPQDDATPTVHDYVETGATHTVTLTGDFQVTDTDGSERISYLVVSDVPNGVIVAGGINNGNGTWTVPVDADHSGPFTIGLVASSHVAHSTAAIGVKAVVVDSDPDGGTDTNSGFISVDVNFGTFGGGGPGGDPVMPVPVGVIDGALEATEDTAFTLEGLKDLITVKASPSGPELAVDEHGVASDGSQVSVVIVVPADWTISGGGYYHIDGITGGAQTYTVPYAALGGVSLTPPGNFSGEIDTLQMRVVVTAADGRYDEDAAALTTMPVAVEAVADGAAIIAATVAGVEDSSDGLITLTLTAKDGDSETLSANEVTIRVHHENGHSPGGLVSTSDAYDLSVVDVPAGSGYTEYRLTFRDEADLAAFQTAGGLVIGGLRFDSAANYSGTVRLEASVQVTDTAYDKGGDVINVSTIQSSQSFTLTVTPEVDATTFAIQDVGGTEDQAGGILLVADILHSDITPPTGSSTDPWSSETLSLVIRDVPPGATLTGAYNNGDGTWTVYGDNLEFTADGVSLRNVSYNPAPDDSRDAELRIVAYFKEAGTDEWVAVTSGIFTVQVQSVADGASLNPKDAMGGKEDELLALDLGARVMDLSESASITISGLSGDAYLTDGTRDPDTGEYTRVGSYGGGTVVLSSADVVRLGLLGSGTVYFAAAAHASGLWNLTATVRSEDTDPDDGVVSLSAQSEAYKFKVQLAAVADEPTLAVAGSTIAAFEDDASIPLGISAELVDRDGSETLSVTINVSGAPTGTVFEATGIGADGNPATWTRTLDGNGFVTFPGEIHDIRMVPVADFNGTVTLVVEARSQDGDTTAVTTETITVTVAPVNDAPTWSGSGQLTVLAGSHVTPMTLNNDSIAIHDVDAGDRIAVMSLNIADGKAGDALGLTGLTPSTGSDGQLAVTLNGHVFSIGYDGSTLTFSSDTAAYADYQTLLGHYVIFTSSTGTLLPGDRAISVTVTDAQGATSDSLDIPVTVGTGATTTVGGDALGTVLFSGNAVEPLAGLDIDPDAALTGMTVTLDGLTGDALALSGLNVGLDGNNHMVVTGTNVSVSYDEASHSLIFSGNDSGATYAGIASGIVLSSSTGSTLAAGTRDLSVTLFDADGSTTLATSTTLDATVSLGGTAAGDVHWGADGSAAVDDVIIARYGTSASLNGGAGGIDTLMVAHGDAQGDLAGWTFSIENGVIEAHSTTGDDKSFVVDLTHGSIDTANSTQDLIVFNGDASGKITFDEHTSIQFDNIERLMG